MLQRLIERIRGLSASGRPVGGPVPSYPAWIAERIGDRSRLYPLIPASRQPRIDVLTLVYNPAPDVLHRTAATVAAQDYPRFRWVIWDNGSTRPETVSLLERLAQRDNVIVYRHPDNLGIVRGHRSALHLCSGDYVALLDHDDELSVDALRITAWFIDRHTRPALLYSDEDKIDPAGNRFCPFLKPDWSPALLQSMAGYTCHLTVFHRELAEDLAVFSDPEVEGTQDWDLALRFMEAGYRGVHIPEVLYSWRLSPQSTAQTTGAKPYVLEAQRHCLEASLARRGLADLYTVESNPIYPYVDGHWYVRRGSKELPPISLIVHGGLDVEGDFESVFRPQCTDEGLERVLKRCLTESSSPYIAYVPPDAISVSRGWLTEAVTQLELNPEAALVGGRVLDRAGRVVRGSPVLGMGNIVGTALRGAFHDDIGYFGLPLTPRNVAAVGDVPWLARREAVHEVIHKSSCSQHYFVTDLCLHLMETGWEIVFSPHITATIASDDLQATTPEPEETASEQRTARLLRQHGHLIRDDPYYSPFASLDPSAAYQICSPGDRDVRLRRLWHDAGLYWWSKRRGYDLSRRRLPVRQNWERRLPDRTVSRSTHLSHSEMVQT